MERVYFTPDEALKGLLMHMREEHHVLTYERQTGMGKVRAWDEPVLLQWPRPERRVLFNSQRDANPIYHVVEALWMLAGNNDVETLRPFLPMVEQWSDDGETLHGAYGHRWRNAQRLRPLNEKFCPQGYIAEEMDQLEIIADELKTNPTSRRCVLQMWNASDDLTRLHGKDVPCNTHGYFHIGGNDRLDLTICNRSNDLLWGMLGSNIVHFSMLLEYMAARVGVPIGRLNQFTNSMHVYVDRGDLNVVEFDGPSRPEDYPSPHFPLVKNVDRFDDEVVDFLMFANPEDYKAPSPSRWTEPFLRSVAFPMICCFFDYKEGDYHGAKEYARFIEAADWRKATVEWLNRRLKKKGKK